MTARLGPVTTLGVHELKPPAETMQRYPGATVGREFLANGLTPRDLRPEFDRLSKTWLAAGGGAYVSFTPNPDAVAAGSWDPHLRQLGAWLADHPGVRVIVNHEPEGDMTGSVFAAMFNRCRDQIKGGHALAVVAYAAMSYQWRPTCCADPASWARANADEYLVDVYSGRSFAATKILPEHTGFMGWYDAIVGPRVAAGEAVAWGLAERGWQAPLSQTRVDTIRREATWLTNLVNTYATTGTGWRPPVLYLAWSSPGAEQDQAWVFDPPAQQAMADLLAGLTPAGTATTLKA